MKKKLFNIIYSFLFVLFVILLLCSCEQKIDGIISTKDFTLSDTNRIIFWQLPGEQEVKYHLQVSENFTFTKLIIEEPQLGATQYRIPTDKLIPNKKYFWRIIPEAPGGIWSQPKELIFARPVPDTMQNTKENEIMTQ